MGVETKLERNRGMGGYSSRQERVAGLGAMGAAGDPGTSIAAYLAANPTDPNAALYQQYQNAGFTIEQLKVMLAGGVGANMALWPDGTVTSTATIASGAGVALQQEISTHEAAGIYAFVVDANGAPVCYLPVLPLEETQVPLAIAGTVCQAGGPATYTGTITPGQGVSLGVQTPGDPGASQPITAPTMAAAVQAAAGSGATDAPPATTTAVPTAVASTLSVPAATVTIDARTTLEQNVYGVPLWGWIAGAAALWLLDRR
jgi:hypothetical protein